MKCGRWEKIGYEDWINRINNTGSLGVLVLEIIQILAMDNTP